MSTQARQNHSVNVHISNSNYAHTTTANSTLRQWIDIHVAFICNGPTLTQHAQRQHVWHILMHDAFDDDAISHASTLVMNAAIHYWLSNDSSQQRHSTKQHCCSLVTLAASQYNDKPSNCVTICYSQCMRLNGKNTKTILTHRMTILGIDWTTYCNHTMHKNKPVINFSERSLNKVLRFNGDQSTPQPWAPIHLLIH